MLKGITNRVKILFLITVLTGFVALWTQLDKNSAGKPVYEDFRAIDTTDLVKVSFRSKGLEHYVAPKPVPSGILIRSMRFAMIL